MHGHHYNTREMAIKALKRRQNYLVLHILRGMLSGPGEWRGRTRKDVRGELALKWTSKSEAGFALAGRVGWEEKKLQQSPEMEKYRTRKSD